MTEIARGAAAVRTPELRGPAGRLEALYTPGSANATCAAVVCHPHPLFGGTMHNKVVYHAAKALGACGLPVLRFNFRGAGASEGAHDQGRGEQDDLLAALDWLCEESGLPVLVAGFSFGAYVALRTCCEGRYRRAAGLIALGLPIEAGDRTYTYEFLRHCTVPKLFVSGAADAFGPVAQVEAAAGQAIPPAPLVWVQGADHFFARVSGSSAAMSGLREMQTAIETWVSAYFLEEATLDASADAQQQPLEKDAQP